MGLHKSNTKASCVELKCTPIIVALLDSKFQLFLKELPGFLSIRLSADGLVHFEKIIQFRTEIQILILWVSAAFVIFLTAFAVGSRFSKNGNAEFYSVIVFVNILPFGLTGLGLAFLTKPMVMIEFIITIIISTILFSGSVYFLKNGLQIIRRYFFS
ncbi:hypothetical protein DSL64_16090 [Dyadobacter luteus]|uniref:Uncharacterized protein n=2 Tax=Dyadobacter luteus TaxID=2259619 RepID=A0A3D8Y9N7_9BACT|nr:hypothetical protein DSL64_16090 [Dyadobacter luteus]